jgi:UPF0755 protein
MSQLGLEMTTVSARSSRRGPRGGELAVLAAAVVVLLVIGIGVGAAVRWFTTQPDYTGDGHGQVTVQVRIGDSISQVAQTLERADVVRSASAFVEVAGNDPSGSDIQPGTYRLRLQMSSASALSLLLDPSSRTSSKVLIPEGLRLDQTVTLLALRTKIASRALAAALAAPSALGLPAFANGNAEGFLFPATYDVVPGANATQMLQMMVRRFAQAEADTTLVTRARLVHLTPFQVVIIASIVQAEGHTQDFAKMARTILNRLAVKMKLQLNSTVNYVLKNNRERLSTADIATPSPYNTYLVSGLPPGPIDSPGEDAINAVLSPAAGNWLYWVTVNPQTGLTKFTNSYPVFLQYKAELMANGG